MCVFLPSDGEIRPHNPTSVTYNIFFLSLHLGAYVCLFRMTRVTAGKGTLWQNHGNGMENATKLGKSLQVGGCRTLDNGF